MILYEEMEYTDDVHEVMNGAWSISNLTTLLDVYGTSLLQQCVSILYAVYLRITLFNMVQGNFKLLMLFVLIVQLNETSK